MNRLMRIVALCAALLWLGISAPRVEAAGTVPLALSVQTDHSGNIAAGCLLYFYQAGTVATPQNAFQDFGLTTSLPNPITCDQSGRLGMFWLADGLIHIRLTDSTGIVLVDTTMQVLGPSSGGGGGGGGAVDPTTILATGDLKVKYGTGALTGFVRANGLTVGNATSGATERANADTQALFIYLYGADPNLVVSGGRTGNALADYNANKTIALPDWRGRIIAGLDDMGNTAAGRLTATYFGATGGCSAAAATVLGVACGGENQTLTLGQAPTGITVNGNVTVGLPGGNGVPATGSATSWSYGNVTVTGCSGTCAPFISSSASPTTAFSFSGNNTLTSSNTSGNPHPNVQPTMLTTIYVKL